jgi:endogenous inhibitor of DNA gyrase (YacG/DUF329 family)
MAITKGQLEPKRCLHCGLSYQPTRDWQKTCSYLCGYSRRNAERKRGITNQGNCARCGTGLQDKKAHAIYCSKTCKSMDHSFKHRSKTRVQSVARRKEIYDRDSGKCYICNLQLDLKEVELDHLIPVSEGGHSGADNLAVSCRFCNRRRGARIGFDQLQKLQELRATL